MSGVVDLLNIWGAAMTALAGVALWQATVVAIVVALVAFALRRSSPAVRYWLWQLVAIKLLLLPLGSWSLGLAWLPALESPPMRKIPPAKVTVSDLPRSEAMPSPAPIVVQTLPTQLPQPLPQVARQERVQSFVVDDEHTGQLTSSVASRLTWQAWLLLGWAAIVTMQIARLFVQQRRLARMLKETAPGSVELVAAVDQIAQQLRMRQPPAVAVTQLDCSPFACGIWRPRVVVPATLLVELDVVQLKQVLTHELAHLQRRDLVWGWITELARLLYFFNPAMLLAARRVRLERELACDQIAMRLSGRGPAEYAETLVRVLSSAAVSSAFRTAAASLDGGEREPRGGECER
jgi:beta-lactamase regulating signal transducer with metallopeptidase domain